MSNATADNPHKSIKMADNKGFTSCADVEGHDRVYTLRARRRHDLLRMKSRAWRVAKYSWGRRDDWLHKAEKLANHIKSCSCWMCGNARKWNGPTIQERRYAQGHLSRSDVSSD